MLGKKRMLPKIRTCNPPVNRTEHARIWVNKGHEELKPCNKRLAAKICVN